jgi:hypothetical protein
MKRALDWFADGDCHELKKIENRKRFRSFGDRERVLEIRVLRFNHQFKRAAVVADNSVSIWARFGKGLTK